MKQLKPKNDVFDAGWRYPQINLDASNYFKLQNYLSELFSGFLGNFSGGNETTYGRRKNTA